MWNLLNKNKLRPVKGNVLSAYKTAVKNYLTDNMFLELTRNLPDNIEPICLFQITDIEVLQSKERVEVNITSCSVKRLIGRNGNIIRNLAKQLARLDERKINVNLKDSELWQ